MWDLGMRFGKILLGSCDPNLKKTDEYIFNINFLSYEMLESFVETFTPYTYFHRTDMYILRMSIMDFYIWYWLGPD